MKVPFANFLQFNTFVLSYFLISLVSTCFCDSDSIVFPDNSNDSHSQNNRKFGKAYHSKSNPRWSSPSDPQKQNEIPLDLIRKLNSVSDAKQLFEEFVEGEHKGVSFASFGPVGSRVDTRIDTRFGGLGDDQFAERKTTLTPKPAACQPELRTVGLRDTNDPTLFYFPTCTRVDRCGGCCAHDLLSCQPIGIEYLNFTVFVVHYRGGTKMGYRDKKVVTVEQHTKCKCDCTTKASDCTILQEYDKDQCRCICSNKDEESKCVQEREKKLWNPSVCACQCREVKECSTGFYFDNVSCECIAASRMPLMHGNLDRTRYKI